MQIIFVPITKVDVEKREVWGRAVQEVPDKTKEIFDYETSAPLFRDWSDGFDKATDGKSLGNIRAMHGKVAAGKVTAIAFNDTEKAIDIGTKIVDDAEWGKCVEGVYTGFSIGGSYEKRWADKDNAELRRYTARPSEISLVDNPCVPTAHFQMVKADGVVEEVPFKTAAPDPAAVEKKVVPAVAEPVKKSMYTIASLAEMIDRIASIAIGERFDAAIEGDASPVPAALRAWLASGIQILNAMTAEESAELLASVSPPGACACGAAAVCCAACTGPACGCCAGCGVLAMAASGDLKKAGARHSASDQAHLQSMHDSSVALGADCSSEKAVPSGVIGKITVGVADIDEVKVSLAKAADDLSKLVTERDALQKKVTELEAMPTAPKGVQKIVGKEADIIPIKKEELEDKSPLGLMKQAHREPHLIKLS